MSITVTFEPCPEYRADHHDGVCEECGWLDADHGPIPAPVIALPRRDRAPLRQAS
jgi:hypothetical protein